MLFSFVRSHVSPIFSMASSALTSYKAVAMMATAIATSPMDSTNPTATATLTATVGVL
jgi:hypothetical protein